MDRHSDNGQRDIWRQLTKYAATGRYPLGMASGEQTVGTEKNEQIGCLEQNKHEIVWNPTDGSRPHAVALSTSTVESPAELILDADLMKSIVFGEPQTISVRRATILHNNLDEDYKMTSKPRGLCLIVNNVEFEDDLFPTRRGSDQDACRFDQLFTQLGFHTIVARNLTADQMRSKFRVLSTACRAEHDALFVFILSHGSDRGIYGTDGSEVYLENEILSCFDNRNCKLMIGKPKVFVIQACRGTSQDYGGGDTLDSVAVNKAEQYCEPLNNRVPTSWLPSAPPAADQSIANTNTSQNRPIRTDMLLVFSCLAGFVSVRNETAGSWLGVALAYFIMSHAHERDLLKILNLVTGDIIQRRSSMGHAQSIEVKLLGWNKCLYFNPGLYI